MNTKYFLPLVATAALFGPAIAHADLCGSAGSKPWMVRLGGHNVDPTGGTSQLAGGALPVEVDSKFGPTFNIDYRLCKNFTVDLLGALPFTQDIKSNGTKIASVQHLPPVLGLQWHPLADQPFDPFIGVGLNYTWFMHKSTYAPLPPNTKLSLNNTWGFAAQAGLDYNIDRNWVVGVDVRYISIEPHASVNILGGDIGKVKINPLAYGVTAGYRF